MIDHPGASTDVLERLISAAGRREAPPAHAYERSLEAAFHVLRAQVRRRRWRIASTLAASVGVLGIALGVALTSLDSPAPAPRTLALVSRVIGDVRVRTDSSTWRSLREGSTPLSSGAVV